MEQRFSATGQQDTQNGGERNEGDQPHPSSLGGSNFWNAEQGGRTQTPTVLMS